MKYIQVKKGKGAAAKSGDRVYMHYSGYLSNGTKFDASYDRSGPLALVLGRHQVIPGWEMGIEGMKVGEQRRLLIPYTLAYGEQGHPPTIPQKANLVFDVELMKLIPDAIPKPFDIEGKDTIVTPTGLKYIKVLSTEAEKVVPGDTVFVKYVAYFENGDILESTYERDDSMMIIAGSKNMLPGIIEAVGLLKEGEKARVIIPYKLGFGEAGRPPMIPAKTTLIFDMYIQSVKKGKLEFPGKE
jgi:peptidylprolyl isomerase